MLRISIWPFVGLALLVANLKTVATEVHSAVDKFTPPPLEVPTGFTIELVAGPPLVKYPMMGCFDERGRLFVAETLGQNLDKKQLLAKQCRFIRMLEDTDKDGKFDKSTIFADRLVMPEGALWHRGSLYVLSSPYLWRFEDTDDNGVADEREKLVGYMDFTGQANQHGAYLGPNGRLYFSGGHLGYDIINKDGTPVAKGRAAAVFSCWEDGSDVQVIGNGGINPVEVAFTADGELLTTCPIFDSIGGRHDALIHWVRGATAGPKDYAPPVLKQTGYRIPSVRRWGQVAPSGLTRYRSNAFGEDYTNSFFATHFNTATVVNTRLNRVGSTFEGADHEFVTSTSRDFHPTDVIEDADGSLLIIDTGGWFLISCPFSKVAKPEITGAIYRIKRNGVLSHDDARGMWIDWSGPCEQLLDYLDDSRPVVRDRAIEALAARGDDATRAMVSAWPNMTEQQRRNAVWSMSRIDTEASRDQQRVALTDLRDSVARAAARSVGIRKDRHGVPNLVALLRSDSMPTRRVAATALGQLGDPSSVPGLLAAMTLPGDDHLRHALVYALIEIGDPDSTSAGLAHSDARVQHAALVALDQMPNSPLNQEQVAPLLASSNELLRNAALQIVTSREGWSDEIIETLRNWSENSRKNKTGLDAEFLAAAVANFHHDARVQAIIENAFASSADTPQRRSVLLKSIGQVHELPQSWLASIRELLADNEAVQMETIAAIASSKTSQLNSELAIIADHGPDSTEKVRIAAWICLAETGAVLSDNGFDALVDQVRSSMSPLDRLAAARAISRMTLSRSQLCALINQLPQFASSELGTLLQKAESSVVDNSALKTQLDKVRSELSEELFALAPTDEAIQQRVQYVLGTLSSGDAKHGESIFYNDRAACSACHTVNGKGGDTGPDLSNISAIRRRPDLLEAILFPSSTIVNSFETYTVQTTDGRVEQGVIQRADSRSVALRDAQGRETTVPRDQIEELQRSRHSIMPRGLTEYLSTEELSDLVAYLESLGKR